MKKVLTVLEQSHHDLSVTEIAKLAKISRISAHYSVKALLEVEKIRISRKVGNIPLYEMVKSVNSG